MSLSNKSKFWLILTIILIILLIISLIFGEDNFIPKVDFDEEDIIRNDNFKEVIYPYAPKNFLVYTSIKSEYIDETGLNKITNLKNKEVQNKINNFLEEEYKKFIEDTNLPKYRGIKIKITDPEKKLESYNYSMYIDTVINNIIAVTFYKNWYFNINEDEYIMVSDSKYYNIDANTGEILHLSDLFPNNYDYVTYLSGIVSDEILENQIGDTDDSNYNFGLASPKILTSFKGIDPNQKFQMSYSGINLVFDYDTPEFDTNYGPAYINIPYSDLKDCAAFMQRFYDYENNENLFIDDESNYSYRVLISSEEPEYNPSKPQYIDKNISATFTTSVCSHNNDKLDSSISDLSPKEFPIEEYQKYVDIGKQYFGSIDNFTGDIIFSVNENKYSDYLSLDYRINYYFYNENYTDQISGTKSKLYTFDVNTGEKINIDTIFKNKYDYKSTFINLIEERYSDHYQIDNFDFQSAFNDDKKYNLYFCLSASSIEISIEFLDENNEPIIFLCREEQKSYGLDQISSFDLYVDYYDIGYDNLKIFN